MFTRYTRYILLLSVPIVALGILMEAPEKEVLATPRAWPTISITTFVTGLVQPTVIADAGDGTDRLFVAERAGRIRLIKSGVLQTTPFLDISARVTSTGAEQGLLGIAFPPNYASKGYFYVYYTNRNAVGDTVVSRFHLTANPDVADPNSEEIILTQTQPYANHNGGDLHFGPDGFLYIALGDGGSGGDPQNYAQNPNTLLGKILRINVEPSGSSPIGTPTGTYTYFFPLILHNASTLGYTIPITNPFANTPGYRGEIWALGLRNPWRFSFDRLTGDLYIADVGQNAREEVNFQPASSPGGENYGWRCYEGNAAYNTSGCLPSSNYVFPVTDYDHSLGCSVTGGYVYRGSNYPAMQGIYFFADFCSARVWGLRYDGSTWQRSQLATAPSTVSTFGQDQAGELYLAGYSNGTIYRVTSP